ncbi:MULTISPECIES: hypothetical protein [unclassified Micromonospora]
MLGAPSSVDPFDSPELRLVYLSDFFRVKAP